MSGLLKLCSGKLAVKKLTKAGWEIDRQVGSHIMMIKEGYRYTLSIPQHKELGVGLLRKIIQHANLSIEEFNNL